MVESDDMNDHTSEYSGNPLNAIDDTQVEFSDNKIAEVAAIRVKRVVARALLRRKHVEKQICQLRVGSPGKHPRTLMLIS